jgi:hypothetical protein
MLRSSKTKRVVILLIDRVIFSCGVRGKTKEYQLTFSSIDVIKATKGLIALTLGINCHQIGLTPVTSAVFFIGK